MSLIAAAKPSPRFSFYRAALGLFLFPALLNLAFLYSDLQVDDPAVFERVLKLSLFLCAWGLAALLYREFRGRRKPLLYAAAAAMLIGLAGFVHLHDLEERSIWLDEDEFIADVYGYNKNFEQNGMSNIVRETAVSAQTPASYYLLYFSTKKFGLSAWSARFPSALLGGLSAGLMFAVFLVLCRRFWLSLAGALLFIVDPFLHYYFQEARPYALGLTACCLFLLSYVLFYRAKPGFFSLAALFGASTILLFSVGFQPVALLAVAALLSLWRYRKSALHFLGATLALAAAVGVFLPYQLNILSRAKEYLPVAGDISTDTASIGKAFLRLFDSRWPLFSLLLLLLVYVSIKAIRSRSISKTERRFFEFAWLFGGFLSTATLLFMALVRWQFAERYFLFSLPLFYVLVVLAFLVLQQQRLFLQVPLQLPKLARAFSRAALCCLCLSQWGTLPKCYGQTAVPFEGTKGRVYRTHWKKLYAFAREHAQEPNVFLLYALNSPAVWSAKAFPAMHVYYPEQESREDAIFSSIWKTNLNPWSPDEIFRQLQRVPQAKTVYLVFPTESFIGPQKLPIDLYLETHTQGLAQLDPTFYLIPILVGKSQQESLLAFFRDLRNSLQPAPELYQINMTLVALAAELKLWGELATYLQDLRPYLQYPHVRAFYEEFAATLKRHS